MSRAHRIGQTRKVVVYRIVTRNTIEETMLARTRKKLALGKAVIATMDDRPTDAELDHILKEGAKEIFLEVCNKASPASLPCLRLRVDRVLQFACLYCFCFAFRSLLELLSFS